MSERIWAGWRMPYIREAGSAPPDAECLFCRVGALPPSVDTLVLEHYPHCFVMLNAFPYTSGHLMVAPRRHDDSILGQSMEERAEVLAAVERGRRALESEYRPDGFNLGANVGRSAGAGVPCHLHWHIVPRWVGDTNFMPTLADTRVLPEALSETYARLLRALEALPLDGLTVTGRGRVP
jgi:ATP adenylyltransferase